MEINTGGNAEVKSSGGKIINGPAGAGEGKGGGSAGATRAGAGAGAGTGAGAKSEAQGAPRLVVLDKPAKSPQKQGKVKQELKNENKLLVQNLTIFIKSTFDLMATVAGQHWSLSVQEATAIAEPGGRILNRLNLTETTNQYTDYILLGMALMIAIVPRTIITMEMKKKRVVRHGTQTAASASSGGDVQSGTSNVASGIKELLPGLGE